MEKDLNKVLAIGAKRHTFETKNLYKDYPCPRCGATDNSRGSYCWQVKLREVIEKSKK